MLSAILTKVTGRSALDLAREWIFSRIGIEGARWDACPKGISLGGVGLSVRPVDMARFGLLIANEGAWEGEQIIPADYIREARAKQIDNNTGNPDPNWCAGYGYQMWRCRFGAFRADGMGGQYHRDRPWSASSWLSSPALLGLRISACRCNIWRTSFCLACMRRACRRTCGVCLAYPARPGIGASCARCGAGKRSMGRVCAGGESVGHCAALAGRKRKSFCNAMERYCACPTTGARPWSRGCRKKPLGHGSVRPELAVTGLPGATPRVRLHVVGGPFTMYISLEANGAGMEAALRHTVYGSARVRARKA